MLERSVAPQSSRPSQIATEWAGTGQAEGNKTCETSKNCNTTLNVSYFMIYVSIVKKDLRDSETIVKRLILLLIPKCKK